MCHDSVHRLTQGYRAFRSAPLLPVAAAPTFRHLGRLTGKNHVIPQTSFPLASNFPWLRFSSAGSLRSLSTLAFTPSFPLGCAFPQQLTHLFLWLRQKWISLGEMLGQRPSLRHWRAHSTPHAVPTPLCLALSLLPQARSHLIFPVLCLQVVSSAFFLLKKGDLWGPSPASGLCSLEAGGQEWWL